MGDLTTITKHIRHIKKEIKHAEKEMSKTVEVLAQKSTVTELDSKALGYAIEWAMQLEQQRHEAILVKAKLENQYTLPHADLAGWLWNNEPHAKE
jgi:hypothetical protein